MTRIAAMAAVAAVAAVAGIISYGHIRSVALAAGETELAALLIPISVDGLIVAATAALLANLQPGGRRLARAALWVGIGGTVAGNVASAEPGAVPMVVAATPAVSFLLAVEVLRHLLRARHQAKPAESQSEATTAAQPARSPAGRGRGRTARGEAAAKVTAAMAATPDASVAQLARLAGVSRSTVRRVNGATATVGGGQ